MANTRDKKEPVLVLVSIPNKIARRMGIKNKKAPSNSLKSWKLLKLFKPVSFFNLLNKMRNKN